MKKVSRILFLVGGIIGLCLGSLFLLLGVLFLIFSLPFFLDIVREGLQNGSISTTAKSVDAAVMIWQMTYTSLSISMFVMSVLGFINAVLSFTARKKDGSKGLYIANIVFGLLSCCELNLVGAILGLIAYNKMNR